VKPQTIYKRIVKAAKKNNASFDESLLKKAYFYAKDSYKGRKLSNGDIFFIHPLKTTYRLSLIKIDETSLLASILHEVDLKNLKVKKEFKAKFGEDVYFLVKKINKLKKIKYLEDMEPRQIDSLRKLFLSTSEDLRVLLVLMAKRIHLLEMLKYNEDGNEQKRFSKETQEIYVPIADGLGMWEFKWRLEDLSFKLLHPEAYADISSEITESKVKMESYIRRVTRVLAKEIKSCGMNNVKISGRVKNIYSIYKKIQFKGKSIDEIYDIIAIRIIVKDNSECYKTLGCVHKLWRPLANRIKDYIAVPKMNGYRSLHTTVFCLNNHLTEIQIRTNDMHDEAEYGMAAHLAYSGKKTSFKPTDSQNKWITELMSVRYDETIMEEDSYRENLKVDVFSDHIFVFTPKGHVKDLPRGATVIDFAYAVHSLLGNALKGAKVNGRMVPLSTELNNGDVVEIISKGSGGGPKMEWINLVKTSKAKTKIRAFLRLEKREEYIKKGRIVLEKELMKNDISMKKENQDNAIKKFPYDSMEDIYVAIGEGVISVSLVIKRMFPDLVKVVPKKKTITSKDLKKSSGVIVEGEKNMISRLAKCCAPNHADSIAGYVTIGRGISIHKKSCKFLKNVSQDRILKARWR